MRVPYRASLFYRLAACALVAAAVPAYACQVPVFQWALENWAPDRYDVFAFHRGPLSDEDAALLGPLEGVVQGEEGLPNVRVHTVDVEGPMDERAAAVWNAQSSPTLPWIVLRYPPAIPLLADLWASPLTREAVEALADSPARRTVSQHLLEGAAAVWVLLRTGDAGKDAPAEDILKTELEAVHEMQRTDLQDAGDGDATFFAQFPWVSLERDDPAEQPFIEMLLRSEPDLLSYDEPMAFPIFGRGRALYALVGPGINADTIQEACTFLAGACSCLVKDQNPGLDMLITADWDSAAGWDVLTEYELPAVPAGGAAPAAAPQPPPPPIPELPTEDASAPRLFAYVAAALALAFAVLIAVSLFAALRKRRTREL
ncbi:MAG: hypothetical protein JXR94_18935 [Candidatus Hydrogenedentes bacterium]|nr:hypothetical protein [Candidatus Hydrogenedentota bacterium]